MYVLCIFHYCGLFEFIVRATEVESNLVAMGFEVTSECVVAHLPDQPLPVPQSSVKTLAPLKPSITTAAITANKPVVTPTTNAEADHTVDVDSKVSTVAAADGPQQSLYEIIRQRSQLKLSTQEHVTDASSRADDSSVSTRHPVTEGAQQPQREPSVKFCLENNAFISASSAEESQCR